MMSIAFPPSYSDPSVMKDIDGLRKEIEQIKESIDLSTNQDRVSIVCFSGDWDRLLAAFIIANGALALGMEVHLFFTFWGASVLRKDGGSKRSDLTGKEKLMGMMIPNSAKGAPLSKMNYGGLGKVMMERILKDKGMDDLPTLIEEARELGAHFHCCDNTMELFGLTCEDIESGDNTDLCGVSTFLSLALKGRMTLFI